jgi:G:T-mismatch repair DNA endonuclease (very short patch repair protein)
MANKARDKRNARLLHRDGWLVLTVWECSLSTAKSREARIGKLLKALTLRRASRK